MLADFFNSLLMSAGGRVTRSMALSGWGCRGYGWGFGGGLRSLFLIKIDDRRRKRPFLGEDSQAERSQHEDGCDGNREFAQKVGGAAATEDGLTGASE